MQTASDLKLVLLQILEDIFQDNTNIQATQQMGVSLSNAVKREGVIIIQNQNVEIFSKMMPLMVKAIKICDTLERPVTIIEEVKKLPPPIEISMVDPVDDCCDWLYKNHFKWIAMQDLMKSRYLEFVMGKFKTKIEAAKWLGVGSTYLCKLSKKEFTEKDLTDDAEHN